MTFCPRTVKAMVLQVVVRMELIDGSGLPIALPLSPSLFNQWVLERLNRYLLKKERTAVQPDR
jgi:hypothetical protein